MLGVSEPSLLQFCRVRGELGHPKVHCGAEGKAASAGPQLTLALSFLCRHSPECTPKPDTPPAPDALAAHPSPSSPIKSLLWLHGSCLPKGGHGDKGIWHQALARDSLALACPQQGQGDTKAARGSVGLCPMWVGASGSRHAPGWSWLSLSPHGALACPRVWHCI